MAPTLCPECGNTLTSYDAQRNTWWCGAELREVSEWRKKPLEAPQGDLEFFAGFVDALYRGAAQAILHEQGIYPEQKSSIPFTDAQHAFLRKMIRDEMQAFVKEAQTPILPRLPQIETMIADALCASDTEGGMCVVGPPSPDQLAHAFSMIERHEIRVASIMMPPQLFSLFSRMHPDYVDKVSKGVLLAAGLRGTIWGAAVLSGKDFPPEIRIIGEGEQPRAVFIYVTM